jgi:hypothetical protein
MSDSSAVVSRATATARFSFMSWVQLSPELIFKFLNRGDLFNLYWTNKFFRTEIGRQREKLIFNTFDRKSDMWEICKASYVFGNTLEYAQLALKKLSLPFQGHCHMTITGGPDPIGHDSFQKWKALLLGGGDKCSLSLAKQIFHRWTGTTQTALEQSNPSDVVLFRDHEKYMSFYFCNFLQYVLCCIGKTSPNLMEIQTTLLDNAVCEPIMRSMERYRHDPSMIKVGVIVFHRLFEADIGGNNTNHPLVEPLYHRLAEFLYSAMTNPPVAYGQIHNINYEEDILEIINHLMFEALVYESIIAWVIQKKFYLVVERNLYRYKREKDLVESALRFFKRLFLSDFARNHAEFVAAITNQIEYWERRMNRSIELHENVQTIQRLARDNLVILQLYYGGTGGASTAGAATVEQLPDEAAAAGGATVEQLPDED